MATNTTTHKKTTPTRCTAREGAPRGAHRCRPRRTDHQAAQKQGVSKTAFVSDAARDAALKVIARAEVTLMAAEVFDQMMASIDTADDSPELEELAALPRRITQ